jgi:Ca2+-binding EF-hand superfamily protein
MLTSKELEGLRKEFEKIDTDNSGYIEADELADAMMKSGLTLTANEIK